MIKRIVQLFLCVLIGDSDFALAEGIGEEPEAEVTWEQMFIDSDVTISNWFYGMADGIDLFLAGKRLTRKKNNTHVRVENSSYVNEGDSLKNTTSLIADLRLPNVEEYWQLKFTSYDEQEENRGIQNGYLRQAPREKNYGASLGLFRKLGHIRTSFQPRIELSDPLKVSHSLTFESVAELMTYRVNPKFELFARADKGTGMYFALNFNMPIEKVYSLTFINNGEYNDKAHLFSAVNGISLGKSVSPKSSISYSFMFNSINQPAYHLNSYGPSISWVQVVYRRILDFQITPYINFYKENGFAGLSGIVLNININF